MEIEEGPEHARSLWRIQEKTCGGEASKKGKKMKIMSNLNKRISNLLTKLRVDEKSVLFGKGKTLDNKKIKIFRKAAM